MSEILREKQKAEALKRMRLMGLREDFIRDFEEDGKVHICTFQKTYPELSARSLAIWTPCSMWDSTPRNGRWIWPI